MGLLVLILALFSIALSVFFFLLPAKLLVIVAWTAQADVRDQVVKDAEKWYKFAKMAVWFVPVVLFFMLMEVFSPSVRGIF